MDCAFKGLLWTQVLEFLSCSDYIYKELRRNKGMTVVFAKHGPSEPDFYIQEEWVDWAFGRTTTDTGSRVAILQ